MDGMSRLPTDGARDLWELPDSLRAGQPLENELDEGETVVWVGRPSTRRMLWRALPIVLFAIPWTAFAIFWTFGAAGFKVPDFQQGFDFFPLFGIPFILIGLGMFSSPYWVAEVRRRRSTRSRIGEPSCSPAVGGRPVRCSVRIA